jgi:4-hydroxy-tetrahydrodipicolinate synthase
VTIGVSGDPAAAGGLLAGCDTWYSVLGGLWPEVCLALTRAAQRGDQDTASSITASSISDALAPLWVLFGEYGSLRVVSAIAEQMGLVESPNLPRPLQALPGGARRRVDHVVEQLAPVLARV